MSNDSLPTVAYFCMEFGLHEELPLYAGGLGILAGDHLKSAGELRLPLVGLGLLWRGGYGLQHIASNGHPHDADDERDLSAILEPTDARITVPIGGREIPCQIFRVQRYGNAPLYLIEPIEAADRWITRRLYGGENRQRIAQELLLGVGGVRALRALGIQADVYHFNEGHAVFAGLELIAERLATGQSFEAAWAAARSQIVFTTHTPVEAGNESHPLDRLQELGAGRGLTRADLKRLGGDPFNMTMAGLRLAVRANGVSDRHGVTARAMWRHVGDAAPLHAITNGVHPGSWQDERVRAALYAPDKGGDLWQVHQTLKAELLAEIQRRTGATLPADGLLIGFARRAAAYKRGDLVLRQLERLLPHLDAGRLQLVFAGKAHPHDEAGRGIVARFVEAARQHPGVVFLPGYDMALGRLLTRGCDVWLNTPKRPMEASGTSGMKAAMNGVLNLSVPDGWWPEGCRHGVNGWQLGDDRAGPDEGDLDHLPGLVEREVLPAHADHRRWSAMMRASIEMSEWPFSSHRMVQEYYETLYAPQPQARRATG
jgi:starch phosphorylase